MRASHILQPKPQNDVFFYTSVRSRCPQLSDGEARQIADLWAEELDRIITRMIEISDEAVGSSLHIEARTDAIFEMAKLMHYLSEKMLAKKLGDEAAAAGLTVAKELAAVDSLHRSECIENTAKNCAKIWTSFVQKWREKWPLIISPDSEHANRRSVSKPRQIANAPGVRSNHYSPVSSNKPWASGSQNHVRVYGRKPNGTLRSRDMSYTSWGREQYLYSLKLERYLALVDEDGARSREKLLDVRPLTDLDKRRWIAFLIVQMLRTPKSMKRLTGNMKRILPNIAPDYPSTPGALKAAYETLFTNNDLYAWFHKLIAPRSWTILHASAGAGFLRPDSTILVEGSVRNANWRLAYPMTPRKVFLVGPSMGGGYERDFVESTEVDANVVNDLNRRFARSATSSVLVHADDDSESMRLLLNKHLAAAAPAAKADDAGLWGPLSNSTG